MATMYKCLLLLLPCICLLILLPFYQLIPVASFWRTDPYHRRRTRVEKACQDFRWQIERDEVKRARTDHPPDPNVLISRKEGFYWCKVPKAASTSWKTYFLKRNGADEAGTENRSEAQISSLVWQKFEHPAHMFLGHSGEDVDGMDNVQIDRHLLRLMSPPRWQRISKILFPWFPKLYKKTLGPLHTWGEQQRGSSHLSQWDTLLNDCYLRTETVSLPWTPPNMSWTRQPSTGGGMGWRLSESTG